MSLLTEFRSNGTRNHKAENRKSLKDDSIQDLRTGYFSLKPLKEGAGLQFLKMDGKLQFAFVMMGRLCLTPALGYRAVAGFRPEQPAIRAGRRQSEHRPGWSEGQGLIAHSFYSSELIESCNAWAKRLQADYSLRTLSKFVHKR